MFVRLPARLPTLTDTFQVLSPSLHFTSLHFKRHTTKIPLDLQNLIKQLFGFKKVPLKPTDVRSWLKLLLMKFMAPSNL